MDALSEEQLGIERLKGVMDFVEGTSLFAEKVDDQGHDAFARGEDRTILSPGRLLIDELGNPEISAERGDQRGRPHGMGEKRLDRGGHRNLGKSGTARSSVSKEGHRILREEEGSLKTREFTPEYSQENRLCPTRANEPWIRNKVREAEKDRRWRRRS